MKNGLSIGRKNNVKVKTTKESTKIPQKFLVKGNEYSTKRVWRLQNDAKENLEGNVSFDKKEIKILHGLTKEEALEVVVHEFIHTFNFEYGIDTLLTDKAEELLTHNLAQELIKNFSIKYRK